jgi:hypothetical protein
VHLNPVKHRLVSRASDWPYSSFRVYVRSGLLPADWAGDVNEGRMDFVSRGVDPGFAEFTLGRTEGATRGVPPGYLLIDGPSIQGRSFSAACTTDIREF